MSLISICLEKSDFQTNTKIIVFVISYFIKPKILCSHSSSNVPFLRFSPDFVSAEQTFQTIAVCRKPHKCCMFRLKTVYLFASDPFRRGCRKGKGRVRWLFGTAEVTFPHIYPSHSASPANALNTFGGSFSHFSASLFPCFAKLFGVSKIILNHK